MRVYRQLEYNVAAVLGLSEDTIKSHMRKVMAELGAHDRNEAVLVALKRGYLDG